MAFPPGVADFKAKFNREFVYGDGQDTVMNSDIERALSEVIPYYNRALLPDPASQNSAYLYAAAHLMVLNIQGAGGLSAVKLGLGVDNQAEGIQLSKGLDAANVSYQAPPDYVTSSPTLQFFWTTTFGRAYVGMIYHALLGNMAVVAGPNPNQWNNE